jgi:hypothetical protein
VEGRLGVRAGAGATGRVGPVVVAGRARLPLASTGGSRGPGAARTGPDVVAGPGFDGTRGGRVGPGFDDRRGGRAGPGTVGADGSVEALMVRRPGWVRIGGAGPGGSRGSDMTR